MIDKAKSLHRSAREKRPEPTEINLKTEENFQPQKTEPPETTISPPTHHKLTTIHHPKITQNLTIPL
jgi:hypothetical protein